MDAGKFDAKVQRLKSLSIAYVAEQSHLYAYESQLLKVGHKKILLENDQGDKKPEFLIVASARLQDHVTSKQIFNYSECFNILSWGLQLQNIMKMPTMEFMILRKFDQSCQTDFFKS